MTRIWTYWKGPRPGWINLCLESLARHCPQAEVITEEAFLDLWTDRTPQLEQAFLRQAPNLQSDVVRAWQLCHLGGIWIDADAIIMSDLSAATARLSGSASFFSYRVAGRGVICSAFLGSLPGSKIATEYWRLVLNRLRGSSGHLPRLALGPHLLRAAIRSHRWNNALIASWRVHPIHWRGGPSAFDANVYTAPAPDDGYENLWSRILAAAGRQPAPHWHAAAEPFCNMLTHQALGPLRRLGAEQLLRHESLAGFLFRRALGEV